VPKVRPTCPGLPRGVPGPKMIHFQCFLSIAHANLWAREKRKQIPPTLSTSTECLPLISTPLPTDRPLWKSVDQSQESSKM
jgi:hypothetical protein